MSIGRGTPIWPVEIPRALAWGPRNQLELQRSCSTRITFVYVGENVKNQYLNKNLIFTHQGLNIELTKSELKFLFFYLNKTKVMSFKKMSRMINLQLSTVYTYVRNIKEKLRATSLEEVAYMLEHSSFYKRLFA